MKRGEGISWAEAAALPLCLLSREMHNRSLMEAAFSQVGAVVKPAIETNSILTLVLSVSVGEVCGIVLGALVVAMRSYRSLCRTCKKTTACHSRAARRRYAPGRSVYPVCLLRSRCQPHDQRRHGSSRENSRI